MAVATPVIARAAHGVHALGGRTAVPVGLTPVHTGGTVAALVGTSGASGFQLLTTAPGMPAFYTAAHANGVWDNVAKKMWVFGANTHGNASDMNNSVYAFNATTGLFECYYDPSNPTQFRMDTNGVYWADAAHTKPWGTHTFRRTRWIAGESAFEFAYDPENHASWPPIFENPAQTTANRQPQMWKFNTLTGLWSISAPGATAAFLLNANNYTFAASWHPTYGWFSHDGSTWYFLSPTGVLSAGLNVFNKASAGYQNYLHVYGDTAFHVNGSTETTLYAKHPLADVTTSQSFPKANYPAVAGMSISNTASCLMPDGRILIFPNSTNTAGADVHAMIIDPVANTVTDTGYSIPGTNWTDPFPPFDLACEWSTTHNCAIYLCRRFEPNRVYAFRP